MIALPCGYKLSHERVKTLKKGERMMHDMHNGKGTVLFDGCDECADRVTTLRGFASLDNNTLQTVVDLHDPTAIPGVSSFVEQKAYNQLRLMGRIVFAAGMTEELAR